MPVRFEDGQPVSGGQPTVLVAVRYLPAGEVAAVRSAVKRLAEEGWHGLWLPQAGDPLAEVAKDAARRAGMAVVAEPGAFADEAHILGLAADTVAVDSALEAYTRCFAGERVIVGQEQAVDGLRQYLALTDAPAAWTTRAASDGWICRGTDAEQGWFSATGADLMVTFPPAFDGVVHLVEPELGEILGVHTPYPGEPLELRGDDDPLAIYCGPNRYVFDDYETGPETF